MLQLLCCGLIGMTPGSHAILAERRPKLRLFDDKSQWAEWIPPSGSIAFIDDKPTDPLLGMLFVGQAEFNWVVDIRTDNADQEGWAVGNLINKDTVLTTAAALSALTAASQFPGTSTWDRKIIEFDSGSDIRINFCRNFLWEEFRPFADDGKKLVFEYTGHSSFSGGRLAKRITYHPHFENRLRLDAGLIEISKPINSKFSEFNAPYVGYMPFDTDETTALVKGRDLSEMESKKPKTICYVVSFGRNFKNIQDHLVIDYKIKYRVEWKEFSYCLQEWSRVCSDNEAPRCQRDDSFDVHFDAGWCFTMRTRKHEGTTGVVCDHDKGAPLVCDGRVAGIVIQGYAFEDCNDKETSTRFLVMKLEKIGDFTHVFQADSSISLTAGYHLVLLLAGAVSVSRG